MEVVEKNAKGTANAFTGLSSLKAKGGDSNTTDVETELDSEITHVDTEDYDSKITRVDTKDCDSETTHEATEDGDSEVTPEETEEDDGSEATLVEVEDDSETVHVGGEDVKTKTIHAVGEDGSCSDTIHYSSSSDEDTIAEMEAAGWLRLMNEVHFTRDLAIDAIAELVEKRNKILKPNFEMASDLCRDEYDRGFALIISSLNESVQIEFEANCTALEDIVTRFDTKASDIKSLISHRIRNTYKGLTIKNTIETPSQDVQNKDGITAYMCICTAILGVVIMSTYPDFPDTSFNFSLKLSLIVFVFTVSFYYCIGKFEGNPRKLQ